MTKICFLRGGMHCVCGRNRRESYIWQNILYAERMIRLYRPNREKSAVTG